MASAVCGVTARPHLPSAVPAAARNLFIRCRAASTMNEASASSPDAEEKKTTTVFVAGSTGRTGKRVVEKLLAKGFGIVAGTTDVSRARGSLPQDPNLQLVRADVTEGVDKLVEAVRGVDAVICTTGFRRSFNPFAPWKDTLYSGSISRSQVAEVAVEALLCPESSYKVVEIIARADAPNRPLKDMYAAIKQN